MSAADAHATTASVPRFELRDLAGVSSAALSGLAAEAQLEGVRNVGMLVQDLEAGRALTGRPGEGFWIAVESGSGTVVGVGGITACPDRSGALRVRRFYVSRTVRRHGVARMLAARCLASAKHAGVAEVTCNAAASAAAPVFWESMGFDKVRDVGLTHLLRMSQAT